MGRGGLRSWWNLLGGGTSDRVEHMVRFRRAIENTPTILLLLGEESCAKKLALRWFSGASEE